MTLTTTPVDGEAGELHGVIYTYNTAQNRWARTALVATNAPGSIDSNDIAPGGVEPTNLNLAVIPATAPPAPPTVGPLYLITPTATGAWAGRENQLATWNGAAWTYTTPTDGLIIWDSAADKLKAFDADPAPGAWVIVNEYVPPAAANSPPSTMRGNLTAVPAPETDNGPQAVVDWLQASGTPFDDLKASILGTPGTSALNGLNASFNVLDRDLSTPPASPAVGATYLVKATGTGGWAGKDGQFASWNGTTWDFYPFSEGKLAWIADENILLGHDGSTVIQLYPTSTAPVPIANGANVPVGAIIPVTGYPIIDQATFSDVRYATSAESAAGGYTGDLYIRPPNSVSGWGAGGNPAAYGTAVTGNFKFYTTAGSTTDRMAIRVS